MRTRIAVPLLLSALIACTMDPKGATRPDAGFLRDVVVLGTADGSVVVSSGSGSVLAEDAGEIAAPDGSRLYATTVGDAHTMLETRDPVSGEVLDTTSVRGDLEARVASLSGRAVALMRPSPYTTGQELALPRRATTIVVADPTGERSLRRYRLEGNFEPEAFSVNDRRLFLIQYLPALAPKVYRVTFLDLRRGEVRPVFGRFKTPPERMPGIRLTQVFDPTSDQLYTLYTNRPARHYRGNWDGSGYGDGAGYGDAEVSFVHVLNLRDGWAFCAGLPRSLWGRPAGAQALAPSPDGRHLYIVDSSRGIVADMDTSSLEILRTARIDLTGPGGDRTSAVTTLDGERLLVGSALDGSAVFEIDTATLGIVARWEMPGPVSSLALSGDGDRLYAALDDRVAILDSTTGHSLASLSFTDASILHVATL
jgi:hypothetical protein